jgi:methanogenic corrinoid protein MtbC1
MTVPIDDLIDALIDGDRDRSVRLTAELTAGGMPAAAIVAGGVEKAMEALDRKCTAEQFNLLEIMLAGRAVMAVIRHLFPDEMVVPDPAARVVVAVLEGDIHDIGKAILKVVLTGSRFHVVDCGKDVPVKTVVEAVGRSDAAAVCVSGLISSVIPQIRALRPALARAGLGHVKVLAGGAALKQCSAESLDVDWVGQTAFDALAYLGALVEARRGCA